MEKQQPTHFAEVFPALSRVAQELLISLLVAAEIGMKTDMIASTIGYSGDQVDRAISELLDQKLVEKGSNVHGKFVVGEGKRYRIAPEIADLLRSEISP